MSKWVAKVMLSAMVMFSSAGCTLNLLWDNTPTAFFAGFAGMVSLLALTSVDHAD